VIHPANLDVASSVAKAAPAVARAVATQKPPPIAEMVKTLGVKNRVPAVPWPGEAPPTDEMKLRAILSTAATVKPLGLVK